MSAHYLFCNSCHKKHPTHQKLFDTLNGFTRNRLEDCPACGNPFELRIGLDFQLGVGDGDFTVVHAFVPDKLESWLGEEEEEVTLYPFLVVLQRPGESRQYVWTPYWHVVGHEARFGQHALCIDSMQFESLIEQAREKMLVPA